MIIIAIDNETVFNQLKNKIQIELKTHVYNYDIQKREDVVELVNKSSELNEEIILITKENLDSDGLDTLMFIKKLKFYKENIRIIWNTDFLKTDVKSILYANEVFDIIEDDNFNIDRIINSLKNGNNLNNNNNDNVINNKISNNDIKTQEKYENIINENKETNIKNDSTNQKNFIAVFGTSGSGKSYISNTIATSIVSQIDLKTCLIDMDFENSCIDILNNITSNDEGISSIVNDIELDKNISNIINNSLIAKNGVDYIINNTSIYDYKNKINTEHYLKIYNEINKRYQNIIVDLPSFPFIDVVSFTLNYATKVIFVVNANYTSLRQAVKYLELINKYFNISKNCISIAINKVSSDSLDIQIVKNILEGYNIALIVNFNKDLEKNINNNIFNFKEKIDVSPILLNKNNSNNVVKSNNKINNINKMLKQISLTSLFERNS